MLEDSALVYQIRLSVLVVRDSIIALIAYSPPIKIAIIWIREKKLDSLYLCNLMKLRTNMKHFLKLWKKIDSRKLCSVFYIIIVSTPTTGNEVNGGYLLATVCFCFKKATEYIIQKNAVTTDYYVFRTVF